MTLLKNVHFNCALPFVFSCCSVLFQLNQYVLRVPGLKLAGRYEFSTFTNIIAENDILCSLYLMPTSDAQPSQLPVIFIPIHHQTTDL